VYFTVITYYLPQGVVQTAILTNAFYRVGQGALGMSLWNQGGGGMKMFANHWFIIFYIYIYIYVYI
jgi:hypothetical protein